MFFSKVRLAAATGAFFLLSGAFGLAVWLTNENEVGPGHVSRAIAPELHAGRLPKEATVEIGGDEISGSVEYTLNPHLQEEMETLLSQYKPDFGAFVALDAKTGAVLALVNYTRDPADGGHYGNLSLRAIFPAASVFKVVTAAAAIDKRQVSSDTVIAFNGRNHTLYRRDVAQVRTNRWTRYMSIREAFARSVNTVFGKLGIHYVGANNLLEYAERFGFNQEIQADFPFELGQVELENDDPWTVVEAASGFTQKNTLSPMHGALIAAAVANEGVMMEPHIVSSLRSPEGDILYRPEPSVVSSVVDARTSANLREMMEETIHRGTSRSAFRSFIRSRRFREIEVGGKTGSLTGNDPKGKCDWFVGYGSYQGRTIAVAALTVHKKYWTVKSSYLARRFIESYFDEVEKSSRVAHADL